MSVGDPLTAVGFQGFEQIKAGPAIGTSVVKSVKSRHLALTFKVAALPPHHTPQRAVLCCIFYGHADKSHRD